MQAARAELQAGGLAADQGNQGRARVCGRRAVGAFVQMVAPLLGLDYGTHAMANLRGISMDADLPSDIRAAAERLLGGARSMGFGLPYAAHPLSDAAVIIACFTRKAEDFA